jgi:hypothetical protein
MSFCPCRALNISLLTYHPIFLSAGLWVCKLWGRVSFYPLHTQSFALLPGRELPVKVYITELPRTQPHDLKAFLSPK